jgi:hypothetical protein
MKGLSGIVFLSATLLLSSLEVVSSRPSLEPRRGEPTPFEPDGIDTELALHLVGSRRQSGSVELRIMPLGASIMSGVGSKDDTGNGEDGGNGG